MQVSLELSGHPKANVRRVALTRTTVVGRSKDCGLQIVSASVSRKHCELRIGGDGVSVVDLGSSNGTFVDAERLPAGEERSLESGARLNLGGVRFVVTFAAAAAGQAGRPDVVAGAAAGQAILPTEEPVLADEPIAPDEPILAGEAIESSDAIPVNGADDPIALDEPNFDDLFGDGPSAPPEVASTESREEREEEEEPILTTEDDEPILSSDEDDAFAFLTEDAPSGRESPPEDSTLGVR